MKKILIITVLLITLLLCGCKTHVGGPSDTPVDTEEIAEERDIVIKDNIFSEKTEFDVGVAAEVYITAPKAEAPLYGENVDKFNQLIEMTADTVKNEYLHDVAIGEGAEGAAATSRMLTYDVYTAKDGYISVLLKINTALCGTVNPTEHFRCISYDLKEGKLLSLTDVVGDEKIGAVKTLILEQMRQNPDAYYSTEDDALDAIDISYSFLEKDETLYIIIDEYAIAPRSQGAQFFEISKGDIG